MTHFYVYALLDPRKPGSFEYGDLKFDYEPFYIGKGHGERYRSHFIEAITTEYNGYKVNKIRKIYKDTNSEPLYKLIYENLEESVSYELEIKTIQTIGRYPLGPLVNMNDGGTGQLNPSDEIRKKLSEGASKPHSDIRKDRRSKFSKEREIYKNFGNSADHWVGSNNPRFGIDQSGEFNENASNTYIAIDPYHKFHYILKGRINKFCHDNELSEWSMRNSAISFENTGIPYRITRSPSSKGWICIKVPIILIDQINDETMDDQQLSQLYDLIISGKFNDYPSDGSTLQAIGSGSGEHPENG